MLISPRDWAKKLAMNFLPVFMTLIFLSFSPDANGITLPQDDKCVRTLTGELMSNRGEPSDDRSAHPAQRILAGPTLPAYSKTADSIFFQLDQPGLKIDLEQEGPYLPFSSPFLRKFRLIYDPRHYFPGSAMRRTFGKKPRIFTEKDIRWVSESIFLGEDGRMLEIYLRESSGSLDPQLGGPFLMINRDSGRVWVWPEGTDIDEALLGGKVLSLLRGLLHEAQNYLNRTRVGTWYLEDIEPELSES